MVLSCLHRHRISRQVLRQSDMPRVKTAHDKSTKLGQWVWAWGWFQFPFAEFAILSHHNPDWISIEWIRPHWPKTSSKDGKGWSTVCHLRKDIPGLVTIGCLPESSSWSHARDAQCHWSRYTPKWETSGFAKRSARLTIHVAPMHNFGHHSPYPTTNETVVYPQHQNLDPRQESSWRRDRLQHIKHT